MSGKSRQRVIGLLGVGFDNKDEHVRITQSDKYQILMGSGETHQALQDICEQIDESMKSSGRSIEDYSPEEFMEMLQTLY